MDDSAFNSVLAAAQQGADELCASLDALSGSARAFATVTMESIFGAHGASAGRSDPAAWEGWNQNLASELVARWACGAVAHVPLDELIARVGRGHDEASDEVLSRVAVALRGEPERAQLAIESIVDPLGTRIRALTELEIGVLRGDAPASLAKLVRAAIKQRNLSEGRRALAAAIRCVSLLTSLPPDHRAVTTVVDGLAALQKKNVGRRNDSCARLAEASALCAGAASASEPQWLEHARTLEQVTFGAASVRAAQSAIARAAQRLEETGAREWTSAPPPPSNAAALTLRHVLSIAPDGPRERAMRASAASRLVLSALEAGERDAAVEAARAGVVVL